ncbi:hybrid sensor histidine kinase/response regulator [Oscillatoriales cyanobacterium LEGE 11467]|uniref:histidine kinase n=1 Tax=Zarconia navalis LEGE 11467 TaxID=1828826 RepID=A0A928Z9C0_9CYAN|nr:hybrid sensor histidine kinase/response regulator [Zarconia navalis]MBE9042490.1 hybrid sensor histidine kinase/response regulator [Zarconia navalis LEGE 11467]
MDETLRLLVVDDDEVDRMALRRALKRSTLSFELQEVDSADVGANLLKSEPFDCAFLDYRMPGCDGLTLVNRLRESGVKTPLIALTGQGSEETAVNLMKAGVSDYLPKIRLSTETLTQAIHKAIRVYRAECEVALANQRLRESHKRLERQNQALEYMVKQRDDFATRLTHDLRTPLIAANRVLELCLQETFGEITEETQEALRNIATSNTNLLTMVNALLEVYRHDAGQKLLSRSRFSLRSLCKEIVEELAPLAYEKGLEIVLDIDDALEFFIEGDRLELRRLITNLAGNAIKFTDTGRVTLRLRSRATKISLEVEDTGAGIDEEDLRQIFERFRQGNHMRVGSGLGLHLAQRIAHLHNGQITVRSTLGEGSVFELTLPQTRSI